MEGYVPADAECIDARDDDSGPWHNETSETVICLRGAVEKVFFDKAGVETERFVLRYGSSCSAIQVPLGVYHTCICLEPGSVIFEAKDRPYDPEGTVDLLEK